MNFNYRSSNINFQGAHILNPKELKACYPEGVKELNKSLKLFKNVFPSNIDVFFMHRSKLNCPFSSITKDRIFLAEKKVNGVYKTIGTPGLLDLLNPKNIEKNIIAFLNKNKDLLERKLAKNNLM